MKGACYESWKKINVARKESGMTQSDLAEKIGVSFQAISSWERDEYLPDTDNIIKLAKELRVPTSRLIDEESRENGQYSFVLRDRMFSEEHMYTFIKSAAAAKKFNNTMKALPYMKEVHDGQFRKDSSGQKIPYIYHPLMMACNALALGIEEDDIIAAILLHDVLEDCGGVAEDLPVNDNVRKTVMVVTKTKAEKALEGVSRIANKRLDRYYDGISSCRDAMVVKILDRLNNVSCMATGFTRDRMAEYIEETEYYILPMMDKLRGEYPEFYNAMFLVKYQMLSVIESLKRTL